MTTARAREQKVPIPTNNILLDGSEMVGEKEAKTGKNDSKRTLESLRGDVDRS